MSQTFTFDGYTVRPISEADRDYLTWLIEEDEYHQNKMTADFFLKLQPGEEAWALEDEKGQIIFYFKTSIAVRMAIQFTHVTSIRDVRRNQSALLKGFQWIEGLFRIRQYREIIFDTEGPELYVFAKRRLGFVDASLVSRVLNGTIQPPATRQEAVGTVPTGRLEGEG
jgi:hypothetical protein